MHCVCKWELIELLSLGLRRYSEQWFVCFHVTLQIKFPLDSHLIRTLSKVNKQSFCKV